MIYQTLLTLAASGALENFTPESERDLPNIQVTAARISKSSQDVAAAVSVVNKEDIGRISPQVLTDVLRGEAGVYVQQTTPGQAIPIVRGLKGSEVLHLVDGMRLNNAFFRNSPNQYLALVDAFEVSQVEVVRGPGSTLYGGDAMGGVVQAVTVQPELDTVRGEFRTRYRSADSSKEAHAAYNLGNETLAWRVSASYGDIGDRRSADDQRQSFSGFRYQAVGSKLYWQLNEQVDLLLDAQYLEQPSTPRFDELTPGFGEDEAASEEFFFEPNDRLFIHSKVSVDQPFAGVDRAEFHASVQEINDDRRTRNTGSSKRRLENNRSTLEGLTAQFNSTVSELWQVTYGVEYYHDEVRSSRVELDIVSGDLEDKRARFPDGSTMQSTAVYLNNELDVTDRWQMLIGARFSDYTIRLSESDRGIGANLNFDDTTWSLGSVLAVTEALNFVTNIGRGFRPPNIFDLGTLGARPGNRFNISNPKLTPEQVTTFDLGFKYQGPSLQWEVAAFTSDYQDKITSVLTGELTGDSRMIVQSQNLNQVDLYGIELGSSYYLGDQWRLGFNLNFVRGKEARVGAETQDADRIPPLNGLFSLRYTLNETLQFDASLRFAARQNRLSNRDIRDSRINPEGTDSWQTLDVAMDWKINSGWLLRSQISNVFDEGYREHGSGIDAAGRGVMLELRANFE